MKCPSCGAEIGDGDFCEYCGFKRPKQDSEQQRIYIASDQVSRIENGQVVTRVTKREGYEGMSAGVGGIVSGVGGAIIGGAIMGSIFKRRK